MLKLFLKIPSLLRSFITIILAFGAFVLMSNDDNDLKIVGYVLLALTAIFMFFDRQATRVEKLEKKNKENQKPAKSKISVSKHPFEDTKNGYVLKWAYYNENIAGARYLNIPYKELEIGSNLTLVKDKKNAHDKNAIKVLYEGKHIGYIHKNHIQEMFNKYSEDETFKIEAILNSIDETNARLQLQIGFYQMFNKETFQINQVIKCAIANTSAYQEEWKNIHVLDYLRVDFNEGFVYKDEKKIGELKANDIKKLGNFARDFRIVYRVGSVLGNEAKGNLTGRIDAYVIED
jgi:hypothetical protein